MSDRKPMPAPSLIDTPSAHSPERWPYGLTAAMQRKPILAAYTAIGLLALLTLVTFLAAGLLFAKRAHEAEGTRDAYWSSMHEVGRLKSGLIHPARADLHRLMDEFGQLAAGDSKRREAFLRTLSRAGLVVAIRQHNTFIPAPGTDPRLDSAFIEQLITQLPYFNFVVANGLYFTSLPPWDRSDLARFLALESGSDLVLATAVSREQLLELAQHEMPPESEITFYPPSGPGFRFVRGSEGPVRMEAAAYTVPKEVQQESNGVADYFSLSGLIEFLWKGSHTVAAMRIHTETRDERKVDVFYMSDGNTQGPGWTGYSVCFFEDDAVLNRVSPAAVLGGAAVIGALFLLLGFATVRELRRLAGPSHGCAPEA